MLRIAPILNEGFNVLVWREMVETANRGRINVRLPSDPCATPYNRSMVTIYGKDTCPYTQAARDDYERRGVAFQYINVKKDAAQLQHMLSLSKGRRAVPVIDDNGTITIGFGGT